MLLFKSLLQTPCCWLWSTASMAEWPELPKADQLPVTANRQYQFCGTAQQKVFPLLPDHPAEARCVPPGPASSIKLCATLASSLCLYLERLAPFPLRFGSLLSKNWSNRAVKSSRGSWTSLEFCVFSESCRCFAQRMEKSCVWLVGHQ